MEEVKKSGRGRPKKEELKPNDVISTFAEITKPQEEMPKKEEGKFIAVKGLKAETKEEKIKQIIEKIDIPKPVIEEIKEIPSVKEKEVVMSDDVKLNKIKKVLSRCQDVYKLEQYELSIEEIQYAIKHKVLAYINDYKYRIIK